MATAAGKKRERGQLEWLPSGSCRVRVYAGVDPVSKRRHYLEEVVESHGTRRQTEREAEKVRVRLINQVNERRNPRTKVTVNQLPDRWLDVIEVERTTRQGYVGKIDKHLRPTIGQVQVGRQGAETIDSLYALLRRCREHCRGRKYIEHRTAGPHACDARCAAHVCRPLSAGSIRVIHSILGGALTRGPVELDLGQSDRSHRAAFGAEAGSASAVPCGGCADRERGVEGSGLGHIGVARHGDRSAAW